jgi:putative transposase
VKTSALCREHGNSDVTFYNWKLKCGRMDVNKTRRLRQLEGENRRLKAPVRI